MEQQGLVRKDLEGLIGTRTRVAEVLNRRRALSISMIRRLHLELGIPADILIGSPQRAPTGTHPSSGSRRLARHQLKPVAPRLSQPFIFKTRG